MKPKTKVQIRVDLLSRKLRGLTALQKKWAGEKLFKHYVYKTKKKNTCLECGHSWDVNDRIPLDHILEEMCPKCGTTLITLPNNKRTERSSEIFYTAIVFEEFQVLRYFQCSRFCKVGKKRKIEFDEICQHWINAKGKHTVRAGFFSPYMRQYCRGYLMEIRKNRDNYYIYGAFYPERKFLKEIRRNGFRGAFHTLHPAFLFSQILSSPMAETLLKARQYELLKALAGYHGYKVQNFWPSIRICIRNNYIVKDASIWFDQLELLKYFEKDLNNPFYICPEELKADHEMLSRRKQRIEKKLAMELRQKKIAESNVKFKKAKDRYFGISLTDGNISIVVLDDVNEYVIEGEKLHHCVFANEYYARKESLILSARKGEKRIGTIELSLSDFRVIQIRGDHNSTPQEYDNIRKVIEANIQLFRKAKNLSKKVTLNTPRADVTIMERIAV
jgi:hypothetical protein